MSETDRHYEDQVRQRAYYLWEQAGQPDGRNEEFWHMALAEISQASDDQSPLEGLVTTTSGSERSATSPKTNGKGA